MTTVRTAIDQVMNWLHPGGQDMPSFDVLEGIVTAGATSMTVEGLQPYLPQMVVEFDDYVNNLPSEQAITREAESSTTIDLNERGYLNTTAAEHADGIKVWLQPRFTKQAIFDAIAGLVAGLHAQGLYRLVQDVTTTYTVLEPVDLEAGTLDVGQVMVRSNLLWYELKEGRDYFLFTGWNPPKLQFFGGWPHGSEMLLNLKKDFTTPALVTDDLTTTCGVPASLVHHIPMGVAGYLLQREEVPRVILDEIRSRAAAEGVQVGSALNVGQAMLQQFDRVYVEREKRNQRERTPTGIVTLR